MLKTQFSHRNAKMDFLLGLFLLLFAFLLIEFSISTHIEFFLPKPIDYSKLNLRNAIVYDDYSLDRVFPYLKDNAPLIACDLSKEIKLEVSPSRPGSKVRHVCYMTLTHSKAREKISINKPVYLDAKGKSFTFSKTKTPLAVVVSEKKGTFHAEIKIDAKKLEQEGFQIANLVGFQPVVEHYFEKTSVEPFLSLFTGTFYGLDLLNKDKLYQLHIDPLPIYFKKGDLFSFEDNRWQKIESPENKEPFNLFKVKSVDQNNLELEGWTSDGKYYSATLTCSKTGSEGTQATIKMSEIRKRTADKISADVSGKRMVLKVGDWLTHKNGKWSILKTEIQKENFLKYKSDSEVFVFNEIIENKGNRKIIGLLYNSSRTTEQRLEFPFANTRKQKTINNNSK